jgi:hypothetical protein
VQLPLPFIRLADADDESGDAGIDNINAAKAIEAIAVNIHFMINSLQARQLKSGT